MSYSKLGLIWGRNLKNLTKVDDLKSHHVASQRAQDLPYLLSVSQTGTQWTTQTKLVKNAGIEPATSEGVLTIKPFP